MARRDLAAMERLRPVILEVAREHRVDPALIAGIVSRESAAGAFLDRRGRGDGGHGHGLMQIDGRAHGSWLQRMNWREPKTNLTMGVRVLKDIAQQLRASTTRRGLRLSEDQLLQAALSGYNTGPSNALRGLRLEGNSDHFTSGKNYAADVLTRAEFYRSHGFSI
ncbi:MAG: transglycosylase SLT domain-containing protein [Myxococcota bacterium]